jgi:ribosomal protein L16 Arg81 hydroxylase
MLLNSLSDFFEPASGQGFLEAFASQQRWLVHSDNAAKFADLLSWHDFNRLITIERLQMNQCRLVLRGRDMPLEMVSVVAADGRRRLAPDLLQQHCNAGLSIAVNNVDCDLPKIGVLTAMLERTLRVESAANIYASFTRESAFRSHADEHDVLVLQVAGCKRWFCFGDSPQPSSSTAQDEQPEWEGVLEPGDVLYVPRGDFHRAEVEGGASLHLTIRLVRPRGRDVLAWLAHQAAEAEILEQDVIRDLPGDEAITQTEQLKAALHRLVNTLDLSAFFAAQDAERPARMPLNLGLSASLLPETRVQLTLRRRIQLPASGPVKVRIGGRLIGFDHEERAVITALQGKDGVPLSEVLQQCVDESPAAEIKAAVARLARRSLVRLD